MNKQDRSELQKAIKLIEEAKAIVESIAGSENEKFENLTEGLQQTERGQKMQDSAMELESLVDSLDDAVATIETTME